MSTGSVVSQNKLEARSELQGLIREFQSKLGSDWDKYHETLSLFLIGKLSRTELVETVRPLLKDGLYQYHNRLLLLNFANSFKDGSLDYQNEFPSFWNKKASRTKNVKSTQYEKFKQNIMGIPIRERRRIKSITRDSGKRGKLNASITLTRHSLLPKIPMIQDKEQQQLQVNNLVQWQQDVVNGINTPIATDNYELPDYDNLSRGILMIMREHGLTGGLNGDVLEVVLLGLEIHLKNIIESAIEVARYNENKYASNDFLSMSNDDDDKGKEKERKRMNVPPKKKHNVVLNIADLFDTLEMYPHITENCGPKLRLSSVMLQNDDMITDDNLYDLPVRPDTMPLTIPTTANGSIDKSNNINNETSTNEVEPGKSAVANKEDKSNVESVEKPSSKQSTPSQKPETHIGTSDELKWVVHDLLSIM